MSKVSKIKLNIDCFAHFVIINNDMKESWKFDYLKINNDFNIDDLTNFYKKKLLLKTSQIFDIKNLPDTMPLDDVELITQSCGFIAITNKDLPGLYGFYGGLGGQPNPYYRPTIVTIANPALNYSKTLTIDKDVVIVRNDTLYMGLMPLIEKTSYLLAQCDISTKFATINSRLPSIVKAKDDRTYQSALSLFKQIETGDRLGLVLDNDLVDGLSTYSYSLNNDVITKIIELRQYILGSFYNDIGLNSAFNMKRESINESETNVNDDILYPTIDEMLKQRKIGYDKVNKMFGTHISVELNSIWKEIRREREVVKENDTNVEEREVEENE